MSTSDHPKKDDQKRSFEETSTLSQTRANSCLWWNLPSSIWGTSRQSIYRSSWIPCATLAYLPFQIVNLVWGGAFEKTLIRLSLIPYWLWRHYADVDHVTFGKNEESKGYGALTTEHTKQFSIIPSESGDAITKATTGIAALCSQRTLLLNIESQQISSYWIASALYKIVVEAVDRQIDWLKRRQVQILSHTQWC